YPIDSWAGAVLGTFIGRTVLQRAGRAVPITPASLAAAHVDFFDLEFRDSATAAAAGLTYAADNVTLDVKPAFSWLYQGALSEAQGA
ncbi:MAG: hypothetical protein VX378_00980, partial [Pseudomonadota bacterium]|nr:hypothetical protein [Pseudomonadota bacterium]